MSRGVGKVLVKGARQARSSGQGSLPDGEVVDVVAQCSRKNQGFHRSGFGLFGEGFANLLDGVIRRVDRRVAYLFQRDAEPDGCVFQVEVQHVKVALQALWQVLRNAANEVLVLAQAHSRDIGELIVFMDETRIRVWGVAAARKDIEDGDGVARNEPTGDGDGERKGRVIAVRREEENLQGVAPNLLKSYFTGMWSRV
jgi:hypothetical protein